MWATWCVLAALVLGSGGISGCSLDTPQSLSSCVRSILDSSKPKLRSKLDPLLLPPMSGGGSFRWNLYNIRVHGLANFRIEKLAVRPAGPRHLAVSFGVSWPSVVAYSDGNFKACAKLFWRRRCITLLRGRPEVRLNNPSASLYTRLQLSLRNGRLAVSPSDTKISIHLPSVSAKPRLRGVGGFFNRILGNPARRVAQFFAGRWWRKNKPKIEHDLKKQLHKLIDVHLTANLPNVLKGFKG